MTSTPRRTSLHPSRVLRSGLLLALGVAGLASGCLSGPKHDGIEVAILDGHRHSDYCGHYYYSNKWYFVKDHHHGVDCGHVYAYGQWTVE